MLEFGKKTIIVGEGGYHFIVNEIVKYLEDDKINVLYASSYEYKTPLSHIISCNKVLFNRADYKVVIDNLFRVDYLLIETTNDTVNLIDSFLPENIKVVYIVDKVDYINIYYENFYIFSKISNYNYQPYIPAKKLKKDYNYDSYIIIDKKGNRFRLSDIKKVAIRNKKIEDLGID